MPAPKRSARDRMIVSTALLVREKGARATSLDDVLAHSGAPRGSIYHHFPGGRQQLLREATEYAGAYTARRLERGAALDPLEALDRFVERYRTQLVESGFRAGCPVAAVAVESPEEDELRDPAARAFADWERVMAEGYGRHGVPPARAHELATFVLSALEGALILCKARRDAAPLDTVHRQVREVLARELGRQGTT